MKYPDFPRAEYEARWNRARESMGKNGLDALLVATESNHRYLSGHASQFWVTRTRPMFFLLPVCGDPVLLVSAMEKPVALSTSWVDDVRAWSGFATAGVDLLIETLRELGLDHGRVGMELGAEQRLGVPYTEFERLRSALPGVDFADAAALLWGLRLIKSPAEVDCVRQAARITGIAFNETFASVRPGMTERDVYRRMASAMMEAGADQQRFIAINTGPDYFDRISGLPTDRVIRSGEALWMDASAVVKGYCCDYCRMAAIGAASEEQRSTYHLVRDITRKCVDAVRPGLPMSELVRVCNEEMERAGLPTINIGRLGHHVGLELTEPPSIVLEEHAPLEPGMIIALEPAILTSYGLFQTEDNILVTQTGHEVLTPPPPEELPIAV